jgi:hypothetical protein
VGTALLVQIPAANALQPVPEPVPA